MRHVPLEYNQYQVGFDASWELDVFGGVRRGVEAAGADLAAINADQQNVLLSALAEVARNYVDLRGYQRPYEIAEENLRSERETLEVTQDRRQRGVITELDVAQAASQVAKTETQLPLLRRAQSEAIHRIAILTGQEPEALTDAVYWRLAKTLDCRTHDCVAQSLPQALEGLGKSQYQGAGFPPPRLHQADVAKAMHCLILFQDGL
jgi:outer membrane protein TolC